MFFWWFYYSKACFPRRRRFIEESASDKPPYKLNNYRTKQKSQGNNTRQASPERVLRVEEHELDVVLQVQRLQRLGQPVNKAATTFRHSKGHRYRNTWYVSQGNTHVRLWAVAGEEPTYAALRLVSCIQLLYYVCAIIQNTMWSYFCVICVYLQTRRLPQKYQRPHPGWLYKARNHQYINRPRVPTPVHKIHVYKYQESPTCTG